MPTSGDVVDLDLGLPAGREAGFRHPAVKSDSLLTVKTNRNDLAHGDKSFADVGRDFDMVRLDGIKNEVQAFLDELLVNVADYIAARAYLTPRPL